MILALAGRRIDPRDAVSDRFPLRNVELVRSRLRNLFESRSGGTVACSAACGADLLALEAAGALGWRRRVILPFDRDRFRGTSVTDRPGCWGALYDRVLNEVEAAGDLLVEAPPPGTDAYAFANESILDEAARLASVSGERQLAAVVWDGRESGLRDLTMGFATAAQERGLKVIHVSTLE